MTAGTETQQVVGIIEDPSDVTGNTYRNERTDAWDGCERWSPPMCRQMGATAAGDLVRLWDSPSGETHDMAMKLATGFEPPLSGNELDAYAAGVEEALQALKS